MIQLIASDMDGTLLTPEKQLPPQFPALLEELYRRDIVFAVASGRSRIALENLFGELAEELIFICDNGACILQPHEAPVFHPLTSDITAEILTLCQTLPEVTPVLCGFHHIYIPDTASRAVQDEIRQFYRAYQIVPYNMLYQVPEPVLKIALCNLNGTAAQTSAMLRERYDAQLEIPISGNYWLDLMCKGVTKGAAVRELQRQMGISQAATMTFGDYENDLSLFECASHSYAMANAPEFVQAQASRVADSNAENGVVKAICQELGISITALRCTP